MVLAYPDYSKVFEVIHGCFQQQLGAVILLRITVELGWSKL
jgi:hypothetical protein